MFVAGYPWECNSSGSGAPPARHEGHDAELALRLEWYHTEERKFEGVELTRATDPVLILIFRGTHQVLSAEKRLKGGGVPLRLIPVPRRLTSDCGLAIRIPLDQRDRAREILSRARLLPVSAHLPREGGEYDPVSL